MTYFYSARCILDINGLQASCDIINRASSRETLPLSADDYDEYTIQAETSVK